jgi:hypothetical protein
LKTTKRITTMTKSGAIAAIGSTSVSGLRL